MRTWTTTNRLPGPFVLLLLLLCVSTAAAEDERVASAGPSGDPAAELPAEPPRRRSLLERPPPAAVREDTSSAAPDAEPAQELPPEDEAGLDQDQQLAQRKRVTPADKAEADPELAAARARSRMQELLRCSLARDPRISRKALAELAAQGVTGEELEARRRLVHGDPATRLKLARELSSFGPKLRTELTSELLRDADAKVRLATLESAADLPPTPLLQTQVERLSRSDPSTSARARAHLLIDKWSVRKPESTPDHSPSPPGGGHAPVARQARPIPIGADDIVPTTGEESTPSGILPVDHQLLAEAAAVSEELADGDPPLEAPGRSSAGDELYDEVPEPRPGEGSTPEEMPAEGFDLGDEGFGQEGLGAGSEGAMDAEGLEEGDTVRPKPLDRPFESPEVPEPDPEPLMTEFGARLTNPVDPPLGYAGRSGIEPRDGQENSHFVPIEDRWRMGFPEWDRYDKGHPFGDDYPYVEGHWWDPYNQNVLKGDYPIIGQHTFLNFTANSSTLVEMRQVPTPTTPFESTNDPFQEEFFGKNKQLFVLQNYKFSFDLTHGNAGFKPLDWQMRLTPIVNQNYLDVQELAIVNPDVRDGSDRYRTDIALQEYFLEAKLADISPDYDFVSARGGSQFFSSDFRGFIFNDTNRAVRLFGTQFANRDQFNLIFFDQVEKDTNSQLNTFDDRHQNTLIANYYRQDFIFPGYTAEMSYHFNRDGPSFEFDKNDFLVRPDPAGVFREHRVDAHYFGVAGDGHMGRFNVSNAAYWVTGKDNLNPIAGREIDLSAYMAALEVSYDRDWARFRTSFFYASGDNDASDDQGQGFDSIIDNPNFAGGGFSYWQRQQIGLFGVNLVQRNSLIPDLRSSKTQGQSNFVNPGLMLVNGGIDMDVTPKLRFITNVNYLWFDKTQVLEQFAFQSNIDRQIGLDTSLGAEYRPFLNNNVIIMAGLAGLFPGAGFRDLYDPLNGEVGFMYSNFFQVDLTY